MDVEKIFRNIDFFKNIVMDKVLFESKYPILFTCKNEGSVYMFICCLVNSTSAKWIATKTNYKTLIDLLEDRITIREAFLNGCAEKFIIEYKGLEKNIICNMVHTNDVPEVLLPTKGEYMEAEDGEFAEEIQLFKSRVMNVEVNIKPQRNRVLPVNAFKKTYNLSEEFFEDEVKSSRGILMGGIPNYQINIVYA